MSFSIDVALDAASRQTIQYLAHYAGVLAPALSNAMEASLPIVEQTATDYMNSTFINPSGAAESAWQSEVSSPFLGILTNTSDYGQRLEYGFSGKTDSLGRYYPYWPDYHWAEHTAELAADGVAAQFATSISIANLSLGRVSP